MIAFGLSIAIALMNLLPIPVLDGGYLVILSVEGIIGRDLPEKGKLWAYTAGAVCLLIFLVFVTFNDISKLVAK